MTTPIFDANFEGLLREAASDKDSLLLRVDRAQILPALRSREAPASVAMAGLSKVERELLASYRCELGFLLRQAAVTMMLDRAETGRWIDQSTANGKTHKACSEDSWRAATKDALGTDSSPVIDEAARTAGEVALLLVGRGFQDTSLLQVAAAALRVDPVDQARIYAGTFLAAASEAPRSLSVLRPLLDGRCSAENAVYAAEGIALALGRSGRYTEAAEALAGGVLLGLDRPEVALRRLFYAGLAASPELILAAAHELAAAIPETHPGVGSFNADLARKLGRGQWHVSSQAAQACRECLGRVQPIALGVLSELAR